MRSRQDALGHRLITVGYVVRRRGLPRPTEACRSRTPKRVWAEIEVVYRRLGGILARGPLNPGCWDLEIAGVAVELDEEQHFNRYRGTTIESTLSAQ